MHNFFGRLDEKQNCWEILKILEENSIEKMIFLLFLEKLLLNIDPWKITPDFYNIFFRFRGGGNVPMTPPSTRLLKAISLVTNFPK